MSDVDPAQARIHLERLLASEQLGKSEIGRRLLTYLFERSLRDDAPKESEIAFDVFGKDASFNGAEDSVVRVGVRTLRHKLMEYYAGSGNTDELQFAIPKGGYRLTLIKQTAGILATPDAHSVVPNAYQGRATGAYPAENRDGAISGRSAIRTAAPEAGASRAWIWTAAIAVGLLVVSLLMNLQVLHPPRAATADSAIERVRESPVWADIVSSSRPLTIVLGDLFMFTQIDPKNGHTLTVRDADINSSEQLRAILANNPSFASERGQRYVSMIQKSTAVGMSAVLRVVDLPGRRMDVEVREDLQADEIRRNDIIYVGPVVGLGPLAGYYQLRSRYRLDPAGPRLIDLNTHRVYSPEGTLAGQRLDYALFAKFPGPAGNHIMIFTSGLRNAGLLENVRTLTSPEGLERLAAKVRAKAGGGRLESFEALITVRGFARTDLSTEVVEVNALPAVRQAQPTDASFPPPSTSQSTLTSSVVQGVLPLASEPARASN